MAPERAPGVQIRPAAPIEHSAQLGKAEPNQDARSAAGENANDAGVTCDRRQGGDQQVDARADDPVDPDADAVKERESAPRVGYCLVTNQRWHRLSIVGQPNFARSNDDPATLSC